MTTQQSVTLTTNEARIILDWDDGKWYVSDWAYNTDIVAKAQSTTTVTTAATNTGGVKVPEWDNSYKYNQNDIVAYKGIMYVSRQNQNQSNTPNDGIFWWNNIINLTAVDAITLEGKNISEIMKDILGGNKISDYYKKTEVENLLTDVTQSVNARRLENLTLSDIRKEYNTLSTSAKNDAINFMVNYLNSDLAEGFDQLLTDEFNKFIAQDNINK